MKLVHLIRHAKSSWDDPNLTDKQRPLNARGRRTCQQLLTVIAELDINGSHCYVSSAIRARQTYEGVKAALNSHEVIITDQLYTFDQRDIFTFLCALSAPISEIIIVGHNPALADIITATSHSNQATMPTASIATIAMDINHWNEANLANANTTRLITPKNGQII